MRLFMPQAVPFARLIPGMHFWPVCPLTITTAHTGCVVQGFIGQESGMMMQENWQLDSQPLPGPFKFPKSHCSPCSTMPLPQTAFCAMHAPFLQTRLFPHDLPFCVPSAIAAHWWVLLQLHVSQAGGACLQSVIGLTQEKVQLSSQPAPGPFMLPLSHCSPGSITPLPQTGTVQTPILQ